MRDTHDGESGGERGAYVEMEGGEGLEGCLGGIIDSNRGKVGDGGRMTIMDDDDGG